MSDDALFDFLEPSYRPWPSNAPTGAVLVLVGAMWWGLPWRTSPDAVETWEPTHNFKLELLPDETFGVQAWVWTLSKWISP